MSLLEKLNELKTQAEDELAAIANSDELEAFRIKYLGSKGNIKAAMKRLKDVASTEKAAYGKAANNLQNNLKLLYGSLVDKLKAGKGGEKGPQVDVTLPGKQPKIGHTHLITQTINELCEIFGRMGFTVETGPEVEDEWHNFEALNIPAAHPARDTLDNFYIDEATMLRSQTSTIQIRVMENTEPPVRIIAVGRVYRPDTVDATHSFMFHQVEGLFVDKGVTMADLKTCLDQFCKAYFGKDIETRFRPSFFPFTEPSGEVDLLFRYPDGTSEWIELGGCGMVDPNVLEAVGYDSEKYTGYAFGLGIERMVMRKHEIPDIRLLFENDTRFLHQF